MPQPKVVSLSADVATRLDELDLDIGALTRAVAFGEAERAGCTENDPAIAPGFIAWARTTRGLRDNLAPRGWLRDREGGLETVLSPNGGMAIAVGTGNLATGVPMTIPKTKYAKGAATMEAVARNEQLSFDWKEGIVPGEAPGGGRLTWLLLIARAGHEVRCELSLPAEVGSDGRVDAWAERIILPAFELDPPLEIRRASDEPDIDVEISRRAR